MAASRIGPFFALCRNTVHPLPRMGPQLGGRNAERHFAAASVTDFPELANDVIILDCTSPVLPATDLGFVDRVVTVSYTHLRAHET